MLPIVVSPLAGRIGLGGQGPAFENRLHWLEAGGVKPEIVGAECDFAGLKLLFVAGLSQTDSSVLAERARALGILVNVEDVPHLCDFHVPALVRRGDLILSVSTGGRAPGLAKMVREWLDGRFGSEWAGYLDQASDARMAWRAEGARAEELSRRTREMVSERNWLE